MRKVINVSTGEETWEEDAPPIVLSQQEQKALVLSRIEAVEAQYYMTRGEREGWIALILSMSAGQGVTEEQLYLANPFYKKLKDANTQIAALRAQL